VVASDPRGILEADQAQRLAVRKAVLEQQTAIKIDRAVLTKPALVPLYAVGDLAQIFRETTNQGGRRAGRWLGPGVLLGAESSHGGRVPRIVYVSYRNRVWQRSP